MMAALTPHDALILLESWTLHLVAEQKSPNTIKEYRKGVAQYVAWCTERGDGVALDRSAVTAFIAGLTEQGRAAATVRSRQLAVRQFSAWLVAEGEVEHDGLLGIKTPRVVAQPVDPFTDDELAALFAACRGTGFRDRRDEALFRLMAETFLRASETVSMTVRETSVPRGHVFIRQGKGGKGRSVFFGAQTARALDRYLRVRRTHRLAGTDRFWLGARGTGFTYAALWKVLKERADQAGIRDAHPHRFRHTGATRWLRKGGSEGGLMAVAGWSRRDMIDRYTAATASERAAEEARALGLGDL